ncbi:3TM-type holin [uncultured Methylophaga sp.]|uniref:3TM-type holin n=1 Tax=uncultured Methylophaga sp. TaxID=285271 RepID=UPI00262A3E50|nr:3TM-type holin [uncultured Methylophaga sp.]
MEPISIALALAQFVPGLTRLLMGDKAGDVAGKVVDAANAVTGADTPDEALARIKQYPELQLKLQQEMNHIVLAELEAENKQLATINATMQVEYTSGDKVVRRWRPFFGYMTAITWSVQMSALAWVIVVEPEKAAAVITAASGLTGMWGIALAVLGVCINKRSHDKQVAAGQAPPNGVFQSIAGIFNRNKDSK